MLEARKLTKIYSDANTELKVLKDIDLVIGKGEVLTIVGPSGAGKSTLLHILGGLDEPSAGEVLLDGVSLSSLDDTRRALIRNKRFGFVFQFYHLLGEFTALENVIMPALLNRGPQKEKNARQKGREILGFLGLGSRVFHRPSQLSGGEQQRVAIARALMNDPEILFCDEPTGNLDYESGTQIYDMLLRLNREKKTTVVIVTHSSQLAEGANRILHIFDGKVSSGRQAGARLRS